MCSTFPMTSGGTTWLSWASICHWCCLCFVMLDVRLVSLAFTVDILHLLLQLLLHLSQHCILCVYHLSQESILSSFWVWWFDKLKTKSGNDNKHKTIIDVQNTFVDWEKQTENNRLLSKHFILGQNCVIEVSMQRYAAVSNVHNLSEDSASEWMPSLAGTRNSGLT